MDPVIVAEDVWKRFGRFTALRGVSLEVYKGEVLGILGPNGAGKTTLLRIILGLTRRDRGRVEIRGLDPYTMPEARRHVGVVFERPTLPDSVSVVEVLEAAARIHGVNDSIVDRVIRLAGLEGHEWKRFNMLSAGLKQRAAIAHALVPEPDILVADEPTSNLDPVERVKILDFLSSLNEREGLTIIISSHVVSEILRVSTRLAILGSGRLRAIGRPEEVLGGYRWVRVRSSNPDRVVEALSRGGFNASKTGLHVEVELGGRDDAGKLLRILSTLASQGIVVYSVDFVEPGLERVIGGAS